MALCPSCGHHLTREHRTAAQKILYSDAFRCSQCRLRTKRFRVGLTVARLFYFSRYTHCIRCGSANVVRLTKRDRIDSKSRNLISQLFRLTGGPLKKCPACRLQYYDWRPLVPELRKA